MGEVSQVKINYNIKKIKNNNKPYIATTWKYKK